MSFDILAPVYRWMELLLAGRKLHRCRCAFLEEVPPPRHVLMLGEGHGRFLVEVLKKFPDTQVTFLDASAGMIAQARKALQRHGLAPDRVTFIQMDVLAWEPPHQVYDLIVTHFFLDCFRPEHLQQLIPAIASSGTPSARWLVADFQEAPAGWQRLRSRLILRLMYWFFRTVTRLPARSLTCPDPLLRQVGLHLQGEQVFEWGLLRSTCWSLAPDCGTKSSAA